MIYPKLVSPTENLVTFDRGDFCVITGTFFYKGLTGERGITAIYDDFVADVDVRSPVQDHGIDWDRLHGTFSVIVHKAGQLWIFLDRTGLYKVYHDKDRTVFSSSFLLVLKCIPHRRADVQAVYEYIFQGAQYGDDTLIDDIKLLSPDYICEPNAESRAIRLLPTIAATDIIPRNQQWHEDRISKVLRHHFEDLTNAFNGPIDTALSGGYDSRLVLAYLFANSIQPRIYVYGKPKDADVVIAKSIAAAEGFEIEHIDKSTRGPKHVLDLAADITKKNFYAFDGAPTDGIFNDGVDLATRQQRSENNALMLNGGGGEVFRNFFYLRNRPYTVKQVLWSFYSQFDPCVGTGRFSEADYHYRLGEKIKSTLGMTGNRLSRANVEMIYPLFRCRYWMGRNNAVNNRFGFAHTPFADPLVIRKAVQIPLAFKNYGLFESRLIERVNSRLAAHTSDYGFPFDAPPPTYEKLKIITTLLRPPFIRKYLFRVKTRIRHRATLPLELRPDFLKSVMAPGFPRTRELLRPEKVVDVGQYNRLCTLEYLFQKMDIDPRE